MCFQEERSRSEHNLLNIQKTHERMQTENKSQSGYLSGPEPPPIPPPRGGPLTPSVVAAASPYYRTKLRGLYTTAKADAEAECRSAHPRSPTPT